MFVLLSMPGTVVGGEWVWEHMQCIMTIEDLVPVMLCSGPLELLVFMGRGMPDVIVGDEWAWEHMQCFVTVPVMLRARFGIFVIGVRVLSFLIFFWNVSGCRGGGSRSGRCRQRPIDVIHPLQLRLLDSSQAAHALGER